jgi:hypothetical protein
MPLVRSYILLLIWAGAFLAGGCSSITQESAKSPLHRAQMSPDSVALDIFFVHCPLGDPEINDSLWAQIDEQQLPPVLRQRLVQNGLRVGLASGQIPTPLTRLMDLSGTPTVLGDWQQLRLDELDAEQKVTGNHVQTRAGKRNEIVASGVYKQLPVLMYDAGGAGGCTYPDARGLFALKATPEPDGRVRLDLVPELQYGETRNQFIGDNNGVVRLEPGQSRRVFDSLAVSAVLSPGQLLVVTSVPTRPGSLGHQFLTLEQGGKRRQKLLLIRLAQTQHQGLFSATEPLDLHAVGTN